MEGKAGKQNDEVWSDFFVFARDRCKKGTNALRK